MFLTNVPLSTANIKQLHGVYTSDSLDRCAHMSGAMNLFLDKMAGGGNRRFADKSVSYHEQCRKFLEEYGEDDLFGCYPGRLVSEQETT